MRAQVWFDLKSSGLPVLAIGVAFAIVIPLLFVVTTRLDVALSGFSPNRPPELVAVVVAMFSLPAVLILGGNAFGIRARQGRTYTSAFEATQACGTARMAGLKVLVRSVCLLAALLAVGTSIWTSASVIPFDVLEDNDTFIEKSRSPVSGSMRAIEGAVGAMSVYELLALAFVAVTSVASWSRLRASLAALRARYPRRLNIAGSLLLLYGLVLVLRAPDGQGGNGLEVLFMDALFGATPWMASGGDRARDRLPLLEVARGAAPDAALGVWRDPGLGGIRGGMGDGAACGRRAARRDAHGERLWMLSPALLPLMASVLAPWSLSRVRHT